jgi:small subunit ribosomal protein S4e
MDVISLEKTKENFRVLYDVKGRFILRKIKSDEAKFKLCKIKAKEIGANKVPYIVTHDGRTLRYPDPKINVGDTIKLELATSKILDCLPQEIGNFQIVWEMGIFKLYMYLWLGSTVYIVSGNNIGRIG